MSVIKSAILLATIMSTGTVYAKNFMTFMGGGGEPQGNDTIFDSQVQGMAAFDQNANWETQVSFNGGHSETEGLIRNGFSKKGISNTPFTEDSYNQIIADYETKIKNGAIKSGDQLLLVISTHGTVKKSDKDLTHDISVKGGTIENFDTGEGSKIVSLDKLKELSDLALKHGIKLGIIDLSCHSGNTLPLKNSHTCVISSTGPNHYGYAGKNNGTYTHQFISRMKKGKSLEQVFLDARGDFTDLSFPMISTPTGEKLNDLLYDPITPYLYSYDPKFDKFSQYVKDAAEQGPACQLPQEKQELMNLISQFQTIKKYAKDSEYYSSDAKKFKESVTEYYNYLDKLKSEYASLKGPDKKSPKEKFSTVSNDGGLSSSANWEYSQEEILSYKVETMKKYYQDRLAANPGLSKAALEAALGNVLKIENRQKELIRQNPDLEKKMTYFKNLPQLQNESNRLARQVADQAKSFYQAYYKNAAASDKSPNPCKDFVL